MGNVTAKTSGEIANFMTPAKTNIKSLKVHFSPKQLGTGDPSPENVREIVDWDGVEVYQTSNIVIPNDIPSRTKTGLTWTTNENGSIHVDGTATASAFYSQNKDPMHYIKGNTTYKIFGGTQNVHLYLVGQNIDGTTWSEAKHGGMDSGTGKTLVLDQDAFVRWQAYVAKNTTVDETVYPRLTVVGTYDEFEPYQGNNISYQWKLPDEYQEVEYIESDGNQYIDLPFGFDRTDEIETRFAVLKGDVSHVSDKYIVSPSRWNDNNNRFAMGIHTAGSARENAYCIGFGNKTTNNTFLQPTTPSDFSMHVWTYKDNMFSIEEIELSCDVTNISFGGTTYPLRLFYGYNSNTMGKIAYYKHKKINGDSYNLIPCYRKSDNEIGMYDTVSQTFYTNQGTGTFIKGEDVDKTFYGGYVDLISGELVEEWGMFTVNEPDSTWRVMAYNRITINFPRKYIFGSRLLKNKSMCTILPENHTDWNYGYIDNVANITNPHALSLNYTGNGSGWSELFGEEATNENVKEHLQEIGFAICATLATPITHQLTPTQLQSFIGQNNFWSNADYVEVEYDLIETIDIQKAKQKIVLNQSQLKTISDKVASFNTDMVAPIKNCKIYFKPIQLGSGDPSPTNVRNINGWTKIDNYVNGDKISVDWTSDAGTVYGGYLDLAKGEVVAEYNTVDLGTLTCAVENDEAKTYSLILPSVTTYQEKNEPSNLYCSSLTPLETVKTIGLIRSMGFNNIAKRAQITSKLYVRSELDTADAVKTSLAGYIVAYKLATPIHYPISSLTSQQLLTLKSTNHIWSETNGQQIDVKYWTYKNLTPTSLTNYLENQTWTDSAYISSSGKKTTNTVSASHFLTNQILLEAGTYVLSGFSHYVGTDNTNYRIHAYDSSGKWLKQITFQQIGNLSPVDISFTLDTDTYVNVSIAMDFDGVLAKIN